MSKLQDAVDALLPDNTSAEISPGHLRGAVHYLTDLIEMMRAGSGFDRETEETMGIIQFCHRASTEVIYQIEQDPRVELATVLTGQTHFADGTTPIADMTVAHYHASGETSFSYWYQGKWIEETGIKTLVIPEGVAGDGGAGGYINYNEDGDLEVATSGHEMLIDETLLTYITVNTNEDELTYFADERHGGIRSPMSHKNDHNTRGFSWAKYNGSIDIEGLADNSNTFTGIADGAISDEDLPTFFTGITEGAHMYRDGVDGQWRIDSVSNALGIFVGGTLAWNNPNAGGAGVWGLTVMAADSDFLSPSFFLTNNKLHPLMIACSQQWKTSRSDARDRMLFQTFRMQMNGMPSPEMLCIGTMIIHDRTNGQIEKGADDELWVCMKRGFPVPRYIDEEDVDG